MKELSISDDDLCSTCKLCQYDPGKESTCEKHWPALFTIDGYAVTCEQYQKIDFPEQNWTPQ